MAQESATSSPAQESLAGIPKKGGGGGGNGAWERVETGHWLMNVGAMEDALMKTGAKPWTDSSDWVARVIHSHWRAPQGEAPHSSASCTFNTDSIGHFDGNRRQPPIQRRFHMQMRLMAHRLARSRTPASHGCQISCYSTCSASWMM